jgi:hypothetical protein
MKTQKFTKDVLDEALHEVLRTRADSWLAVSGHEARKKRRVAIWAYRTYLGSELESLQRIFGIQSSQSIRKILAQKCLEEDEFNWRRFVVRRLETKLGSKHPKHVAVA